MNIDNIRTTIESLKASTTYDQRAYINPSYICGTPGCIAGHAAIDAGYTFKPGRYCCYHNGNARPVAAVAAEWFGIIPDSTETNLMFCGTPFEYGIGSIPKEFAIAMLENFIETGKVNWNIYLEKSTERRLRNEH